jgi:hypothetical protein
MTIPGTDPHLAHHFAGPAAPAAAVVRLNADTDDGWTFAVEEHAKGYIIAVFDEEGILVGYL